MGVDRENPYQRRLKVMGPLETFDARVFVGDEKCPSDVCNFVLALALVYNDFSDLEMLAHMLNQVSPENKKEVTVENGLHAGLMVHLLKQRASVIHEFLNLVEESLPAIEHPFFVKLVKNQHMNVRSSWTSIVSAAINKKQESTFEKMLVQCRNKVTYHFDKKIVGKGYQKRFIERQEIPYISRGNSMETSRLFFADATVEEYLLSLGEDKQKTAEILMGHVMFREVNICTSVLVRSFIESRGGAWKRHRPAAKSP